VSDPKAIENAKTELSDMLDQIAFEEDPYAAAEGAHAAAILTDWKEYKTLDYQRIYDSMAKPAFIFDGRNMLDHQALFDIGFEVYSIGKGLKTHLK
jgi:UDPglucose 6-dehydrogenase